MDKRKNFKRVEHRKRCRVCQKVAQLHKGKRLYCAACYYLVFYAPAPDHSPVKLSTKDVIAALTGNVITSRAAAELIDRVLLERTV